MVRKEVAQRIGEAMKQGEAAISEAKELISFAKKANIDVQKQEGELLQREEELKSIALAAKETKVEDSQ